MPGSAGGVPFRDVFGLHGPVKPLDFSDVTARETPVYCGSEFRDTALGRRPPNSQRGLDSRWQPRGERLPVANSLSRPAHSASRAASCFIPQPRSPLPPQVGSYSRSCPQSRRNAWHMVGDPNCNDKELSPGGWLGLRLQERLLWPHPGDPLPE